MKSSTKIAMGMAMITTVVACTLMPKKASATETSITQSTRLGNRLGFYTGVVNEPAPSLLSLNAAYNMTDYMRLTAGIGRLSVSGFSFDGSAPAEASATTLGVGAKFMVPGWSLTPTAGIHAATVIYSGTPGMISVGGFEQSGTHLYLSGGLDFQAPNGFNVGIGLNQSLKSGVGTSTYLNLGWFFNWLG